MSKEEVKDKEETKETKESGEAVEVPAKFAKLVDQIAEMSVLDLSELVKVLEKKFNVSAAAPVAAMAMPVAGGQPAEAEAEKTSFNIEIVEAGGQKIAVIKALREVTEIGLKDAKDLVDKAPAVVKENVPKADAEVIKKKLEAAGAKVELK